MHSSLVAQHSEKAFSEFENLSLRRGSAIWHLGGELAVFEIELLGGGQSSGGEKATIL